MSCEWIVPERVQRRTGDGVESSQREAESPSFWPHLSDHQHVGTAIFCYVHSSCEEIEFRPIWDGSLTVVEEVVVSCPSCGVHRTYEARGGESIA